MVISDELRYIFYAVPRTASKSTAAWLCKNYKGKFVSSHHGFKDPRVFSKKYFRFCVVRNPFDWIVSFYRHSQVKGNNLPFRRWLRVCTKGSFTGWSRGKKTDYTWPIFSQANFVNKANKYSRRKMNLILRYEELPRCLERLPFVRGHVELPRGYPRTGDRGWERHLRAIFEEDNEHEKTDRLRSFFKTPVAMRDFMTCFKKDLDAFGYDYRPPDIIA